MLTNTAILVLLSVAAVATVHCHSSRNPVRRFDNFHVYRVRLDSEDQVAAIQQFENSESSSDVMLWNDIRLGSASTIMIAPEAVHKLIEVVQQLGMDSELLMDNVQKLIDDDAKLRIDSTAFDWKRYNTLDEINAWLDAQIAQYPNILTNIDIGHSYENRTIRAIRLSHKAGNPAIFIESNIHAPEWITSATATWVLNELLTSQAADVRELVQNYDWYIVPVLNVDGFVYSHQHDRTWRKTRKPYSLFCVGADPNRNFNRFWRNHDGASHNPCSRQFAGPVAESEQEIVAYTKFYNSIAKSVKMYFSFHSFAQSLMFPFGHSDAKAPNHEDLMRVASKGVDAIRARSGTEYKFGPIITTIFQATGSSIDWVYDVKGLKMVFVFEFRDTGRYGFLLPADQIIPNALESFDGIKAMIAEARTLQYL